MSFHDQPSGSRIISRVLPPAIRLWLSTQLDHVENLTFRIEGSDRQILSGYLSSVSLSAEKAVYQGIHLSQATVQAKDIRVNLGQVIRRKPLRLSASFPVSGTVFLNTVDLNESLQSPLLGEGLYDFLRLLARSQTDAAHLQDILHHLPERTVLSHYQPAAEIKPDSLVLHLVPHADKTIPPVAIATQLKIQDGHRLCLKNPCWLADPSLENATELPALQGFEIDLGAEVRLTKCELQMDLISLDGTVHVLPEEIST